ncbi:MAG: class I SAM-dependent methyltransferase [Burkholderiaceae bacterium]
MTPGYQTKREQIAVLGVADLQIRSLLDRQQFYDPQGRASRLGISSAAWPLFGQLWPSGVQLAARLALRPVAAAERILEIGCGLALASLVGHRRGADVTASDCHPLAADFLRRNVRLNHLLPMKYRHGRWGAAQASHGAPDLLLARAVHGEYDLIIGSDVLYERDDAGLLACFIAAHASPQAEVWIVDPNRDNRSAFTRHMARLGFGMRQELLHSLASVSTLAYRGRLLVYKRSAGSVSTQAA